MTTNQLLIDANSIIDHTDLSMLDGKTVMITGASGLVGTHLLYSIFEYIRQGGNIKKCYALILNELPIHLGVLTENRDFEFLRGDLSDIGWLERLPHSDYIIHAAGYGQPLKFMGDGSKVLKLNTLATFCLLDKLNTDGKFLFVSSSAVYTGCVDAPFLETNIGCSNTNHPRSCYIEGKRCGEAIVNSYRERGIKAKSARLSTSYGAGVRPGDVRVLYQLIEKGLRNGCIDLLDDGSTQKMYLYITDAIELLWKILFFGESDIYNVSGKSLTSIYELALKIGGFLSVSVNRPETVGISVVGASPTEILDMSKAEREFGKDTYVPLNEGLLRTISWIKETMNPSYRDNKEL